MCQVPNDIPGCCVVNSDNFNCVNDLIREDCFGVAGNEADFWLIDEQCENIPACIPPPAPIPTLDFRGLIVLAVIFGIVGYVILRKSKTRI